MRNFNRNHDCIRELEFGIGAFVTVFFCHSCVARIDGGEKLTLFVQFFFFFPNHSFGCCSDSSGVTAQRTLRCALNQFDSTSGEGLGHGMFQDQSSDISINTFTHVGNEETAGLVVSQAKESKALLLYTLSDPEIRAKTKKMCDLLNVRCVDLMGPLLDGLSDFLGEAPLGTPGKERTATQDNVMLTDN